jgi:hypothetical protein
MEEKPVHKYTIDKSSVDQYELELRGWEALQVLVWDDDRNTLTQDEEYEKEYVFISNVIRSRIKLLKYTLSGIKERMSILDLKKEK